MNPFKLIIALLCGAVLAGRMFIPHVAPSLPGTYEALAHVFCGVLLGLWMANRDRYYLLQLSVITAVEGVMFFLTK